MKVALKVSQAICGRKVVHWIHHVQNVLSWFGVKDPGVTQRSGKDSLKVCSLKGALIADWKRRAGARREGREAYIDVSVDCHLSRS